MNYLTEPGLYCADHQTKLYVYAYQRKYGCYAFQGLYISLVGSDRDPVASHQYFIAYTRLSRYGASATSHLVPGLNFEYSYNWYFLTSYASLMLTWSEQTGGSFQAWTRFSFTQRLPLGVQLASPCSLKQYNAGNLLKCT